MQYRLGLDMGTNSIGFAIVRLDNKNNPEELVDMGVRIFSDGRNPKDNQPLSLQRRIARGLRRQNDRKIQRKRNIVKALTDNGLFPKNEKEKENLKQLDPYKLRTKALNEKLEQYELGRALFHLGSRRGFQSNRICNLEESSKSTNTSKLSQIDRINKLTKDISESGCRTIGEYLYKRIQDGNVARFKGGDFEGYPSRALYKDEFEQIKKKQIEFYKDIDWNQIYKAIFFQRPLMQQEKGRCQFYVDEYRAYKVLPSAQRFRIAEDVNNLKYYDPIGQTHELQPAQKDILFKELDNCKTKNFNSIRKLLDIDCKFNLESDKRIDLKGNETSFLLRKKEYIGTQWDELPLEIQDEIVDLLMDAQSNEEILENNYFSNLSITDEQRNNILKLSFNKAVSSVSAKFMRDCIPLMEHKYVRYDEAVKMLGLHHSFNPITDLQEELPYYGKILTSLVSKNHPEAEENNLEYKYGKIANPTVHIALNQLRKVINSIIKDYGKPQQIVVELSRDISASAERRAEIDRKQRNNQKENLEAVREICSIANITHPSSWDVKKYKLWKELGSDDIARCCPYCGKTISATQLFSKEIEIEHILPYSRTMDNSMNNLTIAHSTCNLAKGNKTPYEAFSNNPKGFNWIEIVERSQRLPRNKSKLFTEDAIKPFDDGKQGFIERQLNDNRYLSKATINYLSCICPSNNIWGVPGKMTSELRYTWGLNSVLNSHGNSKIRSDHRHHSIDALVVAMTDRSLLQKIVVLNKNNIDVANIQIPDLPFSRKRIEEVVSNINVSIKQDHGQEGRIFLETATGKKLVRKVIPISELTEDIVKKGLLVNNEVQKFLSAQIDSNISFRKVKSMLLNTEIQKQRVNNPTVEVFEEKWITRKDITSLDEKDITGNRIFNTKLQKLIVEKTVDVISDKKALAERLKQISEEIGVKRVRYVPFSQEYEQIKSVPNKWYQLDGICFTIIWKMPSTKGEYKGQFIDYHQVYEFNSKKIAFYPKPHPAAKKIMTLYKNDIIRINPRNTAQEYFAKVAGFSATANKIDIQPVKSSDSIRAWKTESNAKVTKDWYFWEKLIDGQNYKSINTLFSENNISLVKISPSGKVIY